MTVASDFRTYLLAQSAITDLIGTRVHPNHPPEIPTWPLLILRTISRTHAQHLAGIATAGTQRIQIDAWAATRLAADALSEAVLTALRSLAGAPATIGSGTRVCDVEIFGPRDDDLPPADGSDEWLYLSSLDALLTIST